MKIFFILLIGNVQSIFFVSHNPAWLSYKLKHSKNYSSYIEEIKKIVLWKANAKLIEAHNHRFTKGLERYEMELNFLSDLSSREINAQFTGARMLLNLSGIVTTNKKKENLKFVQNSVKSSVDYRNTPLVGPVKNQGACG
jgi:hypothetical protein